MVTNIRKNIIALLRCKETEREKLSVKNAELEKQHKGMKDEVKKLELEVQKQKDSAAGYKSQVSREKGVSYTLS